VYVINEGSLGGNKMALMVRDRYLTQLPALHVEAIRLYARRVADSQLLQWNGKLTKFGKARLKNGQLVRALHKRPNSYRFTQNIKVNHFVYFGAEGANCF
jgi:hypothetical protein